MARWTVVLLTGLALTLSACGDRPVDDPPTTPVGGKADVPADPCLETVSCQVWGRCTTSTDGSGDCVVGSDEDCQGSLFCDNSGYCTRTKTTSGYDCRPGSDVDCHRAFVCQQFGECRWYPDNTCR